MNRRAQLALEEADAWKGLGETPEPTWSSDRDPSEPAPGPEPVRSTGRSARYGSTIERAQAAVANARRAVAEARAVLAVQAKQQQSDELSRLAARIKGRSSVIVGTRQPVSGSSSISVAVNQAVRAADSALSFKTEELPPESARSMYVPPEYFPPEDFLPESPRAAYVPEPVHVEEQTVLDFNTVPLPLTEEILAAQVPQMLDQQVLVSPTVAEAGAEGFLPGAADEFQAGIQRRQEAEEREFNREREARQAMTELRWRREDKRREASSISANFVAAMDNVSAFLEPAVVWSGQTARVAEKVYTGVKEGYQQARDMAAHNFDAAFGQFVPAEGEAYEVYVAKNLNTPVKARRWATRLQERLVLGGYTQPTVFQAAWQEKAPRTEVEAIERAVKNTVMDEFVPGLLARISEATRSPERQGAFGDQQETQAQFQAAQELFQTVMQMRARSIELAAQAVLPGALHVPFKPQSRVVRRVVEPLPSWGPEHDVP